MLQGTTEDERRDVWDVRNGIELPRARCAIILPMSGIPDSLVLVDNAKGHHDHHVQLAHDYGYDPLVHEAI